MAVLNTGQIKQTTIYTEQKYQDEYNQTLLLTKKFLIHILSIHYRKEQKPGINRIFKKLRIFMVTLFYAVNITGYSYSTI